ncbi:MAG: hypothetical protein RMJ87_13790 [Cytophagales bacterium]|nr:hypothetical protein [Bernardetiaceae bacterium]MDW8206095.1 hypothetical protein [Cytophagales bacterium]
MQLTDWNHYVAWEVRFETNDLTPPPFSYYYRLLIRKESSRYWASYELIYTHREELTEEELAEEGFTAYDDRRCEALLQEVWMAQLKDLFTHSQPETRPRRPEHHFLELHLTTPAGATHVFTPKNRTAWELLLQQVAQAIMEAAQIEAPLSVGYLWQVGGKWQMHHICWQFANRIAVWTHADKSKKISWQAAMAIMEQSFEIEPDYERGAPHPKRNIEQISPGDGNWYPLLEKQQNRWNALKQAVLRLVE